jgi:hypothetical protein
VNHAVGVGAYNVPTVGPYGRCVRDTRGTARIKMRENFRQELRDLKAEVLLIGRLVVDQTADGVKALVVTSISPSVSSRPTTTSIAARWPSKSTRSK